ncbi:hypothetical protein, partial [Thermogemmatispora sp.]|uniref:hypothetical protein n=1 Tax=Thermogemmatispora sp. TaxID=1968838 RepID=UPI0035E44AB6
RLPPALLALWALAESGRVFPARQRLQGWPEALAASPVAGVAQWASRVVLRHEGLSSASLS